MTNINDPKPNANPSYAIALEYRQRRGWKPIPCPYASKIPTLKGWQQLTITEANIGEYFDRSRLNVCVQLGRQSGGLTDVDLDCPEALALADALLPPTSAIFGRKSKPRSHRLYNTDLCDSENKASIPYREPPCGQSRQTGNAGRVAHWWRR
jgi:hypothetical protein